MEILVQSFSSFGKCVKQYRDIKAWRVRYILERISNIHLNSKQLRTKSTFGELRPIFYASRKVKQRQRWRRRQRERRKGKGLDMQNNNFARKIHLFVAVTVVVTFKAP